MAGETSIVYNAPGYQRDVPKIVATTWLLAIWIIAAALAAGGLTWAVLTRAFTLSGAVVYAFGAMYGAPLFFVSWVRLAGAVGFRHRPFVVLVALWLIVWIPPVGNALTGSVWATLIVLGGLPVASCVGVLALVLAVRSRQAAYLDADPPAS